VHPGFGGRLTRHRSPPLPGEEVPEVTGPGGDGTAREQLRYVGCDVTAVAAALMANLGALFIYQQQNKRSKRCRRLPEHLLSLCKGQLALGSRHGARSHPSSAEDPQVPRLL